MENKILERGTPEYMEAVERLEELLAKAEVEMGLLKPVPKPQTNYYCFWNRYVSFLIILKIFCKIYSREES